MSRGNAVAGLVRPVVGIVLLELALAGVRGAGGVLGVLFVVTAVSRCIDLWASVRRARVIARLREEDDGEPLPVCRSLCTCGCGAACVELPPETCEGMCACGCGRMCCIHDGHHGECGA